MRVFFLSEEPCALFAGGAYLGVVDGFERSAELDPADCLFLEFIPNSRYLPVRFVFDENFLIDPPEQIELYFLENAVCIRAAGFVRADQSLTVLFQQRFQSAMLTLTLQGKLQLFFSGKTSKLIDLPNCLSDCKAEETAFGYLLRSENAFALISFTGELLLASEGKVISKEKTLVAEVPFHDCLQHTALCEWKDGVLVSCKIRSSLPPTQATLALALFESLLIGADCVPFLTEEMREKAEFLREFLGDFCSVALCEKPDKIGLVYKRRERIFSVRYFRVETEGEKIKNILPL